MPSEAHGVKFGYVAVYLTLVERIVYKVAVEIFVVACHVYQSVTREVEEDDFLLSGFLAFVGFTDGGCDGVARFGSRDYALDTRKQRTGIKRFELLDVHSFHQAVLEQLRHDDAGTMVTETAGITPPTCLNSIGDTPGYTSMSLT